MKPSAFTFLQRGFAQVRKLGWKLLWYRYVVRPRVLGMDVIKCPSSAAIEVHMQVCARDWLNALWTLRSFRYFAGEPFQLLLLCDDTVNEETRSKLRHRLPGADVLHFNPVAPGVHEAFKDKYPALHSLRMSGQHILLPKIMDTSVLRVRDVIVSIDPDVLFFDKPTELLSDLVPSRGFFGRFNLPRKEADPRGAFSLDPVQVRERCGIELPTRFNAGLASLNYKAARWDEVERVFAAVNPELERAFLTEQTVVWLLANAGGWEALPQERYTIEPVPSLDGVVTRHYYGKTRDLFYSEGIPRLRGLDFFR